MDSRYQLPSTPSLSSQFVTVIFTTAAFFTPTAACVFPIAAYQEYYSYAWVQDYGPLWHHDFFGCHHGIEKMLSIFMC